MKFLDLSSQHLFQEFLRHLIITFGDHFSGFWVHHILCEIPSNQILGLNGNGVDLSQFQFSE